MSGNPLVDPEIEVTPERTRELLAADDAVVVDVQLTVEPPEGARTFAVR